MICKKSVTVFPVPLIPVSLNACSSEGSFFENLQDKETVYINDEVSYVYYILYMNHYGSNELYLSYISWILVRTSSTRSSGPISVMELECSMAKSAAFSR